MAKNNNDLGKLLKQRRLMVPMTLQELAAVAQVSVSHLGRIERCERYPSARVLRRLARPLGIEEPELFSLAGYLSSPSPDTPENDAVFRIDPYVAMVLGHEPIEVQRSILALLNLLKNMAKVLPNGSLRDR